MIGICPLNSLSFSINSSQQICCGHSDKLLENMHIVVKFLLHKYADCNTSVVFQCFWVIFSMKPPFYKNVTNLKKISWNDFIFPKNILTITQNKYVVIYVLTWISSKDSRKGSSEFSNQPNLWNLAWKAPFYNLK